MKVLLVVILLVVAVYLLVRAVQRRGITPPPFPGTGLAARPAPKGPVGPDDDEEFLRELDRKRLFPDDPEG
ncbi:hypothetical protein [Nocardioides sp.]|uniref:hypothetical protein n=1 Tax=Nocardioides sp. TaxID=35761 RepID=UPI0039E4871E